MYSSSAMRRRRPFRTGTGEPRCRTVARRLPRRWSLAVAMTVCIGEAWVLALGTLVRRARTVYSSA